jgi:thiol-disulfide isomerase/thioredoxin/sugar lactone lactonase YvrE
MLGLLSGLCLTCVVNQAQTLSAAEISVRSVPRTPAPPLDGGLEWLNTSSPITLPQLRGKIVLLDFWTYCCINCLQTLPDLKRLEEAYPNELVVIGVHAPKFFGERDSTNIREAIVRHGITHPVVNDANAVIASRYKIAGWPSLRFIDPSGHLIAAHDGEATFEALDDFMKRAAAKYQRQGDIDNAPIRFDLELHKLDPMPLRFPGKVLADAESDRLFIADSGHHRIVITSLDGRLLETIGTGVSGRKDGPYGAATFSSPQGMALDGEMLYVADTDNHMIRRVDLRQKMVSTLAGTGEQAERMIARASRQPTRTRLASPWALLMHDGELYIAMAGSHQIWRYTLARNSLSPFAGNGVEDIVDGPAVVRAASQGGVASFAQPSGLASDGERIYVADSEGSSIRAIELHRNARVSTVVGTAKLANTAARLFTFGDRDGPAGLALLQHPLGVAYSDGQLYVADTYNNKVKVIDLASQSIRTLVGDGRPGADDVPPRLNEPAGLSLSGGKLYIADTNNHLIRVVDLAQPQSLGTLEFDGLTPPEPIEESALPLPSGRPIEVAPVQVAPAGNELIVDVTLYLPRGVKLNPDVPMNYAVRVLEGDKLLDAGVEDTRREIDESAGSPQISLPLARRTGAATLEISLTYFYCEDSAQALCKIGSVTWHAPVELQPAANADRVSLQYAAR